MLEHGRGVAGVRVVALARGARRAAASASSVRPARAAAIARSHRIAGSGGWPAAVISAISRRAPCEVAGGEVGLEQQLAVDRLDRDPAVPHRLEDLLRHPQVAGEPLQRFGVPGGFVGHGADLPAPGRLAGRAAAPETLRPPAAPANRAAHRPTCAVVADDRPGSTLPAGPGRWRRSDYRRRSPRRSRAVSVARAGGPRHREPGPDPHPGTQRLPPAVGRHRGPGRPGRGHAAAVHPRRCAGLDASTTCCSPTPTGTTASACPGVLQRLSLDGVPGPVHVRFPAEARRDHRTAAARDPVPGPHRGRAPPRRTRRGRPPGRPFTIRAVALSHGTADHPVPTLGWRLGGTRRPPARSGRARSGRASPPRPAASCCAEGHVTVDGRRVDIDEVSDPRPGQVAAVVMDTRDGDGARACADGADLLVIEATFLEDQRDLAEEVGHLTAGQAADDRPGRRRAPGRPDPLLAALPGPRRPPRRGARRRHPTSTSSSRRTSTSSPSRLVADGDEDKGPADRADVRAGVRARRRSRGCRRPSGRRAAPPA